jgi:glycosyltransferase involved in cell wall biosynthesis
VNAPLASDPCWEPPRRPRPATDRVRVVELVASGTNGGAQEHVASLLTHLDPNAYDVRVISLSDGTAVRRWRAAGFPVEVVREPGDGAAVERVAALLEEWRTQVLHGHMYRAEVVGTRAAHLLQERGLPRPYVMNTVHSSRVRSQEDRALLRALTPSMDRLVAVSRSIMRKLAADGRVGPPVELVYNGVDLKRYDQQEACCTLPEEYGFEPGSPMVGVVARLEPEKGHPTLLEAWPLVLERVPEARLLIIGEGSRRDALEAQARELDLLGQECSGDACVGTRHARPGARVVFTGLRDDVPAVTAALDVAVLPSYREAQGLVILEAMALSRPVVASRVGGIPEMIEDGVTGLLVPPRDPEALAAAITRLLLDHPLADSIARAGHDLAHERFCLEAMVSAIQRLYDEGARSAGDRETVPALPAVA